jgi:hypothetical protein
VIFKLISLINYYNYLCPKPLCSSISLPSLPLAGVATLAPKERPFLPSAQPKPKGGRRRSEVQRQARWRRPSLSALPKGGGYAVEGRPKAGWEPAPPQWEVATLPFLPSALAAKRGLPLGGSLAARAERRLLSFCTLQPKAGAYPSTLPSVSANLYF